MTPGMHMILLVVGALVSALLTALLQQVSGLREDMRGFLQGQKDMNDRLIKLETEHGVRSCGMTTHGR